MEFLYYILAGALVGLAVGLTGVGGGSLMTPILLALGFPLNIAVGTDLLFSAVTKSGGAVTHSLQRTVRWDLVAYLVAGSLPATALTIAVLRYRFHGPGEYSELITTTLGLTLILTSLTIFLRARLTMLAARLAAVANGNMAFWLPIAGAILGVLLTLSSVGAGAIATAMLMLLYPGLSGKQVVGTGLALAVPLTLSAGLGHLYLGNVDFTLLAALLVGSLPAVSLGSRLARFIPERYMRAILASTLCGVGIKFTFF